MSEIVRNCHGVAFFRVLWRLAAVVKSKVPLSGNCRLIFTMRQRIDFVFRITRQLPIDSVVLDGGAYRSSPDGFAIGGHAIACPIGIKLTENSALLRPWTATVQARRSQPVRTFRVLCEPNTLGSFGVRKAEFGAFPVAGCPLAGRTPGSSGTRP